MTRISLRFVHAFVDRHGKARHYLRYKGQRWPLPGIPGSAEFMSSYQQRLDEIATGRIRKPNKLGFIRGSLGWVIESFLQSQDYRAYKPNTHQRYRHVLDLLRRSYGAGLLADLTPRHVRAIRDRVKGETSTSTADCAVTLLSLLWGHAGEFLGLDLPVNPTIGTRRVHRAGREHEPWPADVIEAFEKHANPMLRLALRLLLFTGQRRGDVVSMRWSQFDGETIKLRQQKTGQWVEIPCHQRLREVLEVAPRINDYILNSSRGEPFHVVTLSAAFRSVLKSIGAKGLVLHGLRKNAGVALADCGCDLREVMSVLGHRTAAQALHYTKRADQRRRARAAMDKWERAGGQVANLGTKRD